MPLETGKKPSKLAKRILCAHEAGHTVLGWNEPLMSDVKKARVWFRQRRGVTTFRKRFISPCDERDYLADIAVDLAGAVAEKIIFGQWSNVNGSDLKHAREQIEEMVCEHGMSKLGPLHLVGRPMSAVMRHRVETEVERILQERLAYAEKRLRALRKQLDLVAVTLLKRKKLRTDDIRELIGARPQGSRAGRPKKGRSDAKARRK